MNKEYLDKVLDKLVSETRIDYDTETMYLPYITLSTIYIPAQSFPFFYSHCRDVYGLNEQEIEYVWDEYKEIFKKRINKKG